MANHILRVDSSPRDEQSHSRDLADAVVAALGGEAQVTERDVSDGLPPVGQAWIGAAYSAPEDRTPEGRAALEISDTLIAELKAADVVVISLPIYNFTIPAALKTWVDQVARAGVTFEYSESGPKGLLENKRAILTVSSGGTKVGSDQDYATPYMKHFLGFLGISDVEVFAADSLMQAEDPEAHVEAAKTRIREELAA